MSDLPPIANKVIKFELNDHGDMQSELNRYADDGFKVVSAVPDGRGSVLVFLTKDGTAPSVSGDWQTVANAGVMLPTVVRGGDLLPPPAGEMPR